MGHNTLTLSFWQQHHCLFSSTTASTGWLRWTDSIFYAYLESTYFFGGKCFSLFYLIPQPQKSFKCNHHGQKLTISFLCRHLVSFNKLNMQIHNFFTMNTMLYCIFNRVSYKNFMKLTNNRKKFPRRSLPSPLTHLQLSSFPSITIRFHSI